MHALLCNTEKNRFFIKKNPLIQRYKDAISTLFVQNILAQAGISHVQSATNTSMYTLRTLFSDVNAALKKHAIAFIEKDNKAYQEIMLAYEKACNLFRQDDTQRMHKRRQYRKNNQYGPTKKPVKGFPRKTISSKNSC